jgi:hypothetical protein
VSRGDKQLLLALFLLSLGWALIASHGVALWDDDYAGWFRYALPKSTPRLILEWLSPIPTRTEGWAFQNRPAQALAYKLIHALFGYRAAVFFAVKSCFWAGLVTLDCAWVLRVGRSRIAALLPALLLLTSPSVMASFIWHADYGLLAECALSGGLLWCFILWESDAPRKWLPVFFLIYLGYGTKAHVKCIPVILLAYQALFIDKPRRRYWLPLAALALAIPWSPRLLGQSAPFWPGSGGSPVRWMTQEWSVRRIAAHVAAGFSFWPRELPHSLSEELGPALLPLGALAVALIAKRTQLAPHVKRALGLVLLWIAAVAAVMGALPDLPPYFSVRYGLLLLSPVGVLAGLALSQAWPWLEGRRWLALPGAAALALSLWCNGALAVGYRDSLGGVTRAVDAAYAYVDSQGDGAPLLLLPGFLGFDYRADSSIISRRRVVGSLAEAEGLAPLHPWALGWEPQFSEQLGLVRVFDGCAGFALRASDCALRAYLFRVGDAPQAESLNARFQSGLAAAAAGDNARFLAVFEALTRDAPTAQVRYNYALALQRNRRFAEALREWKTLIEAGVRDRGTLLNALETARAAPDPDFAKRVEELLK